eukprot:g10725.t1
MKSLTSRVLAVLGTSGSGIMSEAFLLSTRLREDSSSTACCGGDEGAGGPVGPKPGPPGPKPDQVTYIPLGYQCASAAVLLKAEARSAAYPFDWVFLTPDVALYYVQKLLSLPLHPDGELDDGVPAADPEKLSDLVKNDWLDVSKGRSELIGDNWGGDHLWHRKHKSLMFPHELSLKVPGQELSGTPPETWQQMEDKYIRRFKNLRTVLLSPTKQLKFVYIGLPQPGEEGPSQNTAILEALPQCETLERVVGFVGKMRRQVGDAVVKPVEAEEIPPPPRKVSVLVYEQEPTTFENERSHCEMSPDITFEKVGQTNHWDGNVPKIAALFRKAEGL